MSAWRKARKPLSLGGWVPTLLYAICVVGVSGGLLAYATLVPRSLDIGTAVAARALAYQRSFREVDQARSLMASGEPAIAEERLLRFLTRTQKVQRNQLESHAVVEAYELLVELNLAANKLGRAGELATALTERTPLHYRAWLLRGQVERIAGDLAGATSSLDRAFRLSLVDLEVVETYLQVLDEQGDYARVLWVEDQYRRGARRARPTAVVKVGVGENELQRRVLEKVGIPIEHGRFFRGFESRGLLRGESRLLACPPDLFKDWPEHHEEVLLQVRFEHVGELRIDGVRYRTDSGELLEVLLDDSEVRYLHRAGSVNEYYAEFGLEIPGRELESLEIVYSTPSSHPSEGALAIIDKAHANYSWQGGAC